RVQPVPLDEPRRSQDIDRELVTLNEGLGLGSAGFVERHGLYSDEQAQGAVEVVARIEELGLRTVRLVLVDQHGVPRRKPLSGEGAIAAMRRGADFSGAIFSLDTGHRV